MRSMLRSIQTTSLGRHGKAAWKAASLQISAFECVREIMQCSILAETLMVVVQARILPLSLRVPVDAEVGDFIAALCVVNVTSARQPEFFLKDDGGGRVTL